MRARIVPLAFTTVVVCVLPFTAGPVRSDALTRPADDDRLFRKRLAPSEEADHALARLTFGARPGDISRFHSLGRKRWLDEQLLPESVVEDSKLQEQLEHMTALTMSPAEIAAACLSANQPVVASTSATDSQPCKAKGRIRRTIGEQLSEAKILRARYSHHQLAELLDDFWFNHFNIFLNKGPEAYLLPAYEREVIRPHLFGRFDELLVATAKSPAMLFYLDNWQSMRENDRSGNRASRRGLNENYARELLELQTMGVNSGYTQRDVIEVARCFTGWTIEQPQRAARFIYRDRWHDKDQKVVLGHVIQAGGGMNDGLTALAILSHQPATAHFISQKLAERFVADHPPASLVSHMAAIFLKTNGDLSAVMRAMLTSPEFWSQGAYRAKIRTPLEFITGSLRALDANVSSSNALRQELTKLGEPLYLKVEPTGYSANNTDWLSSSELLERMNFATALSRNRLPGVQLDLSRFVPMSDGRTLVRMILGHPPLAATAAVLEGELRADEPVSYEPTSRAITLVALILGSPDFQHH